MTEVESLKLHSKLPLYHLMAIVQSCPPKLNAYDIKNHKILTAVIKQDQRSTALTLVSVYPFQSVSFFQPGGSLILTKTRHPLPPKQAMTLNQTSFI